MKKTILLAISLVCCLNSYAQHDFREGFCITNSHDTISGFINYEEALGSIKRVKFKKKKKDEAYYYYPADVVAFGFYGDKYYESILMEDESSRVFMQVLVRGLATLYKYNGNFFIRKGDSFKPLEAKEKLVEVEGRTYLRPSKAYIGTLNYLLFDCEEVHNDIKSIKVVEKSLIKLVKKYNNCMGAPQQVYKEQKPWSSLAFEPAFGLVSSSLTKTTWKNNLSVRETERGIAQSLFRPFGGITVDISSPRVVESLSLQLGLFYLQPHYYAEPGPGRLIPDTDIQLQELKFPLSLRYTHKVRSINWYGSLGGSVSKLFSDQTPRLDRRTFSMSSNLFGAWGGVGAQTALYKNLMGFIEIRYERTNSLEGSKDTTGLRITAQHLYTFVGLRF
jgi:hypothetical protein